MSNVSDQPSNIKEWLEKSEALLAASKTATDPLVIQAYRFIANERIRLALLDNLETVCRMVDDVHASAKLAAIKFAERGPCFVESTQVSRSMGGQSLVLCRDASICSVAGSERCCALPEPGTFDDQT